MGRIQKVFLALFLIIIISFSTLINAFTGVKSANASNLPLKTTNLVVRPVGVVYNPDKPILYYLSSGYEDKIFSVNYQTGEVKSAQFQFNIKQITISNGEIYMACVEKSQLVYDPKRPDKGIIAILDPITLKIKEQFSVNIYPENIAVDRRGFIYLNSYKLGYLKSYSRTTKQEVLENNVTTFGGPMKIHPVLDRLYLAEESRSYTDIYGIKLENGKARNYSFASGFEYKSSSKIWVSPDGKYVFNSAGAVFKSGDGYDTTFRDLSFITYINDGFVDISFDMENKRIYTAMTDKKIKVYDYDTLRYLGVINTSGYLESILAHSDRITAVMRSADFRYSTHQVFKNSMVPDTQVWDESSSGKSIMGAVYDSQRDKVYAIDAVNRKLLIFNAETNVLEKEITLISRPAALTISQDGSKLYIANNDSYIMASEFDLTTLSNTKNLMGGSNSSTNLRAGDYKISQVGRRLFIKIGNLDYKLHIFNLDTYKEINYSSQIDCSGPYTVSPDGKYLYTWRQTAWNTGFEQLTVSKYLLDEYSYVKLEGTFFEDYNEYQEGLDMPMFLLEDQKRLIVKNQAFNLDNLNTAAVSFDEPIYAIDKTNNLAVGINKIFDLNTGKELRNAPRRDSKQMVFDSKGRLHYFVGMSMYSMDPASLPDKLSLDLSPIQEGDRDVPIDYPIIVKYDSDIKVLDEPGITLKGNGQTYYTKPLVKNNALIIDHEDLQYDSSYTLSIKPGTISSTEGTWTNDDYTLSFNTGKEYMRIWGNDRYETSVSISKKGWDQSNYVILATGEDFPDALSASSLAKKLGAPILLTHPERLLQVTEDEIKRLGVSEVYIIGGHGAVSKDIEEKLASMDKKITRIMGNDRYETALAIANHMNMGKEIIVATGNDFPDALSIASYAASNEIPIILTDKDKLPDGVKDLVEKKGIDKAYVVGGTGVISDRVLSQLPNAERVAGSDRYETNTRVLMKFNTYLGNTFIATGEDFPDALSCSALAGALDASIVLVNKYMAYGSKATNDLALIKGEMKIKYTVGGEGVVPSKVVEQVFK